MELPRGKVITVEKEASLPIWIPEKVEDWDVVEVVGDELEERIIGDRELISGASEDDPIHLGYGD